tara:strand:- start:2830 stop:3777 length:948 start_codon:yes stop_codon:yes gene_type:complete
MNKTLLITGAAGFIGSNLCKFYIKKNFFVIGVDNFITGKQSNINEFLTYKNFQFINHDVRTRIDIKKKIDIILHFASPASPKDYLKHPIITLQTGSTGTENILELAKKNKATVMVASTSEIYGDPLVHPQDESYFGNVNPIGPRSVYDEAKRYQEAITIAFKNMYDLDIRIPRIFNTYGPMMKSDDGRVIPNFINQSLNGDDFTVYGDGLQTRCFCYIDDLITGINDLLFSNYNMPVNLGSSKEYSMLELIKIISEINSSSSKITFFDLPQDDPKMRRPNLSLASKIINFKNKIALEDGLLKTINYFKELNIKLV